MAIILSGGPASVYEPSSPQLDKEILELARHKAIEIFKIDINLEREEHQKTKEVFMKINEKKTIWNYIS